MDIQSVGSFNPFTGGTTVDGGNFFFHFATHFDFYINSKKSSNQAIKQSLLQMIFFPTIQSHLQHSPD